MRAEALDSFESGTHEIRNLLVKTAQSKVEIVQRLSVAIEQRKVSWPGGVSRQAAKTAKADCNTDGAGNGSLPTTHCQLLPGRC